MPTEEQEKNAYVRKDLTLPQLFDYRSVPVGDAPKESEYTKFKDFMDQYGPGILTKEEQEKRKRAMAAVSSVGALGNAISAFSNLSSVGGVAPSQKLPDVPDASMGIKDMEDRQRKAMADYLNAIDRDGNRYERAYQRWLQGVQANNSAGANRFNNEMSLYQAGTNQENRNEDRADRLKDQELKQDNWKQQFDANERHQKEQEAQGRARIAYARENEKYKREHGYYNGRGGSNTATSSPQYTRMMVPGANGEYVLGNGFVDLNALHSNTEFMEYAFNKLSPEDRRKYESDIRMSKGDPKKIEAAKQRAMSKVLETDSTGEVYTHMLNAGYLYDQNGNKLGGDKKHVAGFGDSNDDSNTIFDD